MDCSFCGDKMPPGTGAVYVTARGKAFHFCSSKCRKNLLVLKRKPRKIPWTKEYLKEKEIRVKSKTPAKDEKKTDQKEAKPQVTKEQTTKKKPAAQKSKAKAPAKKSKSPAKTKPKKEN